MAKYRYAVGIKHIKNDTVVTTFLTDYIDSSNINAYVRDVAADHHLAAPAYIALVKRDNVDEAATQVTL